MNLRTSLLAILLLAGGLAIACNSAPGPVPPTATPATPATAPPAPAPTATAIPLAAGAIPDVVRQVVEGVVSRDVDRLNSLVAYQQVGCTKALGGGGPPKCKPGDPEGTVYRVFPVGRCEGEWVADARPIVAQIVAAVGQLYAVARTAPPNPDPEPYWPKGDSVVLFKAGRDGSPGGYFILGGSQVLRAHLICDSAATPDDALIRALGVTAFLVPPPAR